MIGNFSKFININKNRGGIIVQPRMGFGTISQMLAGLEAIKNAKALSIGTITIDSYTRANLYERAREILTNGGDLNGFPIVTHGTKAVKKMLNKVVSDNFVVQVRHGTALPLELFEVMVESGINASEGGPVSYCLPYSRVRLSDAVDNWSKSCKVFAKASSSENPYHIESFGGCMLGQLCPPSLLIAFSIIECIFFMQNGIPSVSASYAQGTDSTQDLSALKALNILAKEYLANVDWHIVMYSYMGLFPVSVEGAEDLINESARVATVGKCSRLIVKTTAEAFRIPTIIENVTALEEATKVSNQLIKKDRYIVDEREFEQIYNEAKAIIESVLGLNKDLGKSIVHAFQLGILDVPYCLHAENKQKTKTIIDKNGYLKWADTGNLPFSEKIRERDLIKSSVLLQMLSYVRNKYDANYL